MPLDFFGNTVLRSATPTNTIVGGANALPLVGTAQADSITGGGLGHPMSGLLGDDTYKIKSLFDSVSEAAGQGNDTISVAGTKGTDAIKWWYLPDNVENLVLSGVITGFGNSQQNIIDGSTGTQVIVGGGGNDILTGGVAADTFHFSTGSGYDVVTDFSSADGDLIRLQGYGLYQFSQVQAAMTQVGGDVILQLSPTDAIKFLGTTLASFHATDFLLPVDTGVLQLTFADEFDTLNLDPETGWDTTFPFGSPNGPDSLLAHTHNDELQIYVDPTYTGSGTEPLGIDPFSVDSGVLTITLQKTTPAQKADLFNYNYTSGLITTAGTFYQQYGYFEMRAKLPVADGMWSAFWLLPKDQADTLELDVFENIGDNRTYATEHHIDSTGKKIVTNQGHVVDDISQFHTYGMLWTATDLVWYIDGVAVYTQPTSPDMNRPMYILANLALGGRFSGAPDPGLTTAAMQIDYIRAYDVDPFATQFTVNNGATPPAYDTYPGDGTNNDLEGSSGADLMQGFGGNDTVDGGLGNDTMDGGDGVDTLKYAYSPSGVTVSLAISGPQNTIGAGVDTITGFENLLGSNKGDDLTGDDLANQIDGRGGDDIIEGGLGNDNLRGSAGLDTASYAHASGGVTVSLAILVNQNTGSAGTDKLAEFENLLGSDFNDVLTGDAFDNVIQGGLGADVLDGGLGIDTVSYAGATAGVTVDLSTAGAQDTGGAGIDTLVNFENLLGSAFADTLTGDANANRIDGGLGDDTLAGGLGDDVLDGNVGSDTASYAGATSGVTVDLGIVGAQDTGGAGIDTLARIENLIGSDFADVLRGAAGANTLQGGLGADLLSGDGGDDVMDGGGDVDTVSYDDAGSAVTVDLSIAGPQNTVGGGTDTLSNIENLTGSAFGDTLTGDAGANVIMGGQGVDLLAGGLGDDTLDGGADVDTATYAGAATGVVVDLSVVIAQDTVGAGLDTLANIENLIGSAFADTLTGDGAANRIDGGLGDDSLYGGGGDDLLIGGGGSDKVFGGDGLDTLLLTGLKANYAVAQVLGDLRLTDLRAGSPDGVVLLKDMEKVQFADFLADVGSLLSPGVTITGTAAADNISTSKTVAGQPFATGLSDTIYGLGGNDKLDGGGGSDLLVGGLGDDTYYVNVAADQVQEAAGEGKDTVIATASFVLSDNVENLTLSGSAALTGTGNGLDNKIVGNSGANTLYGMGGKDVLDGGAGADTMYGGAADDTYTVDNVGDQVIELAGEGKDTVKASVTFTLGAEVEDLTLSGSAAIDGTGNNLANKLTGNNGANVLTGGAGADTLSGGSGDDTLIGGTGKDKLTGGGGADTFVFGPAIAADADTVADFVHLTDHLAFKGSDYGLSVGALDPGSLVFGAAAIHAHSEFIFDAAKKALLWDADGVGGAAAVTVATFSTAITLTASDFLILA